MNDVADDLAKLANRQPMTDAVKSFMSRHNEGDELPGEFGTVARALLEAAVQAKVENWDVYVYVDDYDNWITEPSEPWNLYEGTYYSVTSKGDVFAWIKTRA